MVVEDVISSFGSNIESFNTEVMRIECSKVLVTYGGIILLSMTCFSSS